MGLPAKKSVGKLSKTQTRVLAEKSKNFTPDSGNFSNPVVDDPVS
jgi:hypothetical protein